MNSAEIAKLANVSRATVSRVLNGHSNVSASTKEKIERIMREHNYFPDEAARKLAGKSNQMIRLCLLSTFLPSPASTPLPAALSFLNLRDTPLILPIFMVTIW